MPIMESKKLVSINVYRGEKQNLFEPLRCVMGRSTHDGALRLIVERNSKDTHIMYT
jgi:hypothetical protein